MLVYFTVCLIVLMGFCGLVVDVGRMEVRTLQLQAAADVSALGAANELERGTSNWSAAAAYDTINYLSANNLPAVSGFNVTLGPATGPFASDYSTVQVSIQQPLNTIFLGLLSSGSRSYTVSVSATAQMAPCTYYFANPASNTWHNLGEGYDIASASLRSICPVYSKSTYYVDGFSEIYGGAMAGGATPGYTGGGYATVSPGHVAFSDPLAGVVQPILGTCTFTGKTYTTAQTINPGTYCGTATLPGLTITSTTITMNPGLYVITGGWNITGSTLNGTGVTVYFTKGGAASYGVPTVTSSTLDLSAPTVALNGSLPQILMMNDRHWTGGNEDIQFYFSSLHGDGLLYFTGTGIYQWATSMSGINYFNIVAASQYSYDNQTNLFSDYSAFPGGSIMTPVITLVQ